MNPYAIPPLITVLLSLSLGIFVFAQSKRSRVNQTFALWCFLTAYWQACWVFLFNTDDVRIADTLARLGYSGIIFIPIVFFHFVFEFVNNVRQRWLVYLCYILGGIFLVSVWNSNQYVKGIYRYYWGFYPRVGSLHLLYFGLLCLMLFTGLYLLTRYRRKVASKPIRINQANYIFGSTVIYSLASIDFLANYGHEFYPVGLVFTNIHAGIIAYAIVQYRLLDINVVLKQSLIYTLVLLSLLIPCYLLVMWGQSIAFGNINYYFSITTLMLFFIVGFLFPKFRFKTEEALERALFKRRYDYRQTLLRSSKDMVSIVDLESISDNLVHTVGKALGIEKVTLFHADESKGIFDLKASIGFNGTLFKDRVLLQDDPFVQRLTKRPEVLVREEMIIARNGGDGSLIAERMGQIEAEVAVPLRSKEKLVGILNLGHKEGKEMYSPEDLEVLSTLANQAAIAVDNAGLYENLKQSQNIIRRADRLSSLGMLTAGLAHEIRNPLVAIRTFTQLLPERYADVEFRENFQAVALKEVDRICAMVNDLLSFARPSPPNIAAQNVNEIVDSIARILETEAKEKDVRIELRLESDLPSIAIDKEQIKQVLMNFVLNAIQAIDKGGAVALSTRLFAKERSKRFVQIGVQDNGVGVAEKDLENIFNPFFTTKKEGNGLGLSISHQIVQEHGGYIVVESKLGEGSTFFINLPVGSLNHKRPKARSQVYEKDPGR